MKIVAKRANTKTTWIPKHMAKVHWMWDLWQGSLLLYTKAISGKRKYNMHKLGTYQQEQWYLCAGASCFYQWYQSHK